MTHPTLTIETERGRRAVSLAAYLDAAREEAAAADAHAWIKALRNAPVDGMPLRRRFTFREDSLWWFAELYLHKQRTVLNLFRTIAALEALIVAERPTAITVGHADRVVCALAPLCAARHGVRVSGRTFVPSSFLRLAAIDARAAWLHLAALASRLRRKAPHLPPHGAAVLAFVHRAFWRSGSAGDDGEQYIGPVLKELAKRLPAGGLQYVSVGPQTNFRARRWWHPVVSSERPDNVTPVEAFATLRQLAPSRALWRQRHVLRRALWQSADLRAAARIQGYDCWPIIQEELAGVALLQWPWSARAMDEAGAALDALSPAVALTYAEAGGWGRAIILESRRRGIHAAGLQHGFIYRHWLNYRHEPDEMAADAGHAADRGFPHPSLTLLFDAYARRHLIDAGHFPADALRVTGSPRLDELTATAASLGSDDLARARSVAGAGADDALVLVTTKYQEAARVLPEFLTAALQVAGVHVAIKTHPAETPEAYLTATRGRAHVTVLPASVPLAPLIRASRAIVTVNSTVAIDAAVLGVPTLVLGLPNNLSPFVEAGVMAAAPAGETAGMLRRILYDEGFRRELHAVRAEFLSRFDIASDGRATERAAEAVLGLIERQPPACGGNLTSARGVSD